MIADNMEISRATWFDDHSLYNIDQSDDILRIAKNGDPDVLLFKPPLQEEIGSGVVCPTDCFTGRFFHPGIGLYGEGCQRKLLLLSLH